MTPIEPDNLTLPSNDSTASVASYRRYGRLVFWFLCISQIITVVMNLTVDPYNCHSWSSLDSLTQYQSGRGTRIGRGESLHQGNYQVLFTGTSRVQNSLDPAHPLLYGKNVFNASLPKATMMEIASIVKYAIQENPDLESIVLGLDYFMFADCEPFIDDYYHSRLYPDRSLWKHSIASVLSSHVTRKSLVALGDAIQGKPSQVQLNGKRLPPVNEERTSPKSVFAKTLKRYITDSDFYGGFQYNDAGLNDLQQVLRIASATGIQVYCVINCSHATLMESLYQANLWSGWEAWKLDLLSIVESVNKDVSLTTSHSILLCDFTGFTAISTEPVSRRATQGDVLEWFRDPSHGNFDLGALVLSTLFGDAASQRSDSFGVCLTSQNWASHMQLIRMERAQWIAQYPDELAWVHSIVSNANLNTEEP